MDTLLTALGKVFADDTKLISKIADLVARYLLQEDLFNVIQWVLQNNMQLRKWHHGSSVSSGQITFPDAHPFQNNGEKQARILLPGLESQQNH